MPKPEKTLAASAVIEGIGIHSGRHARLTISPAAPGSGIRFFGGDGSGGRIEELGRASSERCTGVILPSGDRIEMVEHLLAAISICGLSNLDVQVEGPEIPILDGSSLPWIEAFAAVGFTSQGREHLRLAVTREFRFEHRGSEYLAVPGARHLTVSIDFPGTAVGRQSVSADEAGFADLAAARTFAFESEISRLREAGLAAGGSLDNALVISSGGPVNPGGYRFPHECAMHKALDLLGDLMLAGRPIDGSISATKPGHAGNRAFLRKMLAEGVLDLPVSQKQAA